MYSNESHWINDAQSLKESVMSIGKIVRASAIRVACVLLTAGPVMVASGAQAGEPVGAVPHKVVGFQDLNLDTPEGAAVLYRRINSAAYEVCGNPDRYDLSELKLQTCVKDAVSRAIAEVNRPELTSLYRAKTGKADKQVTTLAQAR